MKLSSAPRPCIASVLAQHSEELAFTWQRRQRAWSAPNHRAAHLFEIDSQLDAHLDGLHIAGRDALAPAMQRFQRWGSDEEAFAAAAVVGLCATDAADEATRAELDSLLIANPRSVRGAAAALFWISPARALPCCSAGGHRISPCCGARRFPPACRTRR